MAFDLQPLAAIKQRNESEQAGMNSFMEGLQSFGNLRTLQKDREASGFAAFNPQGQELGDIHRGAKIMGLNHDQGTIDEKTQRPIRQEQMNFKQLQEELSLADKNTLGAFGQMTENYSKAQSLHGNISAAERDLAARIAADPMQINKAQHQEDRARINAMKQEQKERMSNAELMAENIMNSGQKRFGYVSDFANVVLGRKQEQISPPTEGSNKEPEIVERTEEEVAIDNLILNEKGFNSISKTQATDSLRKAGIPTTPENIRRYQEGHEDHVKANRSNKSYGDEQKLGDLKKELEALKLEDARRSTERNRNQDAYAAQFLWGNPSFDNANDVADLARIDTKFAEYIGGIKGGNFLQAALSWVNDAANKEANKREFNAAIRNGRALYANPNKNPPTSPETSAPQKTKEKISTEYDDL